MNAAPTHSTQAITPFAAWLRKALDHLKQCSMELDSSSRVVDEETDLPHPEFEIIAKKSEIDSWLRGETIPRLEQLAFILGLLHIPTTFFGNVQVSYMVQVKGTQQAHVASSEEMKAIRDHVHRSDLEQEFERVLIMPHSQSAPAITSLRDVHIRSSTLADHYSAGRLESAAAQVTNLPLLMRVQVLDRLDEAIYDTTLRHSPSWDTIHSLLDDVERNHSPEESEAMLRRLEIVIRRELERTNTKKKS